MQRFVQFLTLSVFTVGIVANLEAAPTIYGASFSGSDGLATFNAIDPLTGAATPVGPIGFERVSGMDFHPVTGVLYATGERADGSDTPVLITIDTSTGAGTEVAVLNGGASHTFGDAYADISFRNSDSTLYAYLESGDGLGTIDIGTGALTELGDTFPSSCCGNGMAFSSADVLLHSSELNLNTLDQVSGAAAFVASMGFSSPADDNPRINGMDFDPGSGILYGSLNDGSSGSPENYLATIDTITGVATIIGVTADGMDALAVRVIPEPSTFVLAALSSLLGIGCRRRKQA